MIDGLGPEGLRFDGTLHALPALVLRDRVLPWQVGGFADIDLDTLAPVLAEGVELLLVGCGARMQLLPRALRDRLKAAGLAVETMDTGAACRTYNFLTQDGRLVAAALLA